MHKLFFDIESTGIDPSIDRIVSLAIKIVAEDGTVIVNKQKMYNPNMAISQKATAIHGITDAMVKDCPTFAEDAKKLKRLFENKIIVGYNCMVFDIPIVMSEFDRAGVEVELTGKFIDIFKVEQKLNPRSLANVYKSYTGKTLENAHDAEGDNNATAEILDHQIAAIVASGSKYPLEDIYEYSGTKDFVDYYGKFGRDEQGYLIFAFGKKCKGKRVIDEPAYAQWMLDSQFPAQVKKMIQAEQQKATKQQFTKPEKGYENKYQQNKGQKGFYKPPGSGDSFQPLISGKDNPF
jgi:DNA polymerase-3 subunit epsilon